MRRRGWIYVRRFWRVHRWRAVVAVAALPVVIVMVHSAVAGTGRGRPLPSRAAVCAAAHRAVADAQQRFPDATPANLDAAAREACSHDPVYAPVSAAKPFAPSPGCHLLPPANPRQRVRPHTAVPPRAHVPFFAARSGTLPASGTPIVAGIRLPEGSRCGPFWSTDQGVPDGFGLARKLSARFADTGLWPVVWSWEDEEPDAYVYGGGDPARADRLKAEAVLRNSWQANHPRFPGLALPSPEAERTQVDPFSPAVEQSLIDPPPPGGPIVMLVPVNRPADVYAILRPHITEYFSDYALTAVLRSWEERFGAVVTALSPSSLELAVGAPPGDDEQAWRLAIEQVDLAPDDSPPPADLQRLLRTNPTSRGTTSAHYWALGWPD